NGDLQCLAALEADRGTPGSAVDENPSGLEERLHARAAELGEARGDGAIEAFPAQRRSDREPVDLASGAVALWCGAHVGRRSVAAWPRRPRRSGSRGYSNNSQELARTVRPNLVQVPVPSCAVSRSVTVCCCRLSSPGATRRDPTARTAP